MGFSYFLPPNPLSAANPHPQPRRALGNISDSMSLEWGSHDKAPCLSFPTAPSIPKALVDNFQSRSCGTHWVSSLRSPFLRPHFMEGPLSPREACRRTPTPLPELLELIYNGYKRGQSLIKLNRSINYTKQNKHNEHKNLRPPSPAQMCPLVRSQQILQSLSISTSCRINGL